MTGTSRRAFFRSLAGELSRAHKEVTGTPRGDPPAPVDVAPAPPAPVAPPPPARLLAVEDLLAEATLLGLGERHAALRELALVSRRLVPGDEAEATCAVGGAPAFPAGGPWPERDGRPLAAIAQLDRSAWPDAALDDGDRLCLFAGEADVAGNASGPVDWGPLHTAVAPAGAAPSADAGARPVVAHPELVLPRVWTAAVQALDLDDAETEAWEALRTWSASSQGTVLGDGPGVLRIDRVLGYPDERQGAMPELCERATGVPRERWRLLLQLTRAGDRLYVWLPGGDLRRARVVVQRA